MARSGRASADLNRSGSNRGGGSGGGIVGGHFAGQRLPAAGFSGGAVAAVAAAVARHADGSSWRGAPPIPEHGLMGGVNRMHLEPMVEGADNSEVVAAFEAASEPALSLRPSPVAASNHPHHGGRFGALSADAVAAAAGRGGLDGSDDGSGSPPSGLVRGRGSAPLPWKSINDAVAEMVAPQLRPASAAAAGVQHAPGMPAAAAAAATAAAGDGADGADDGGAAAAVASISAAVSALGGVRSSFDGFHFAQQFEDQGFAYANDDDDFDEGEEEDDEDEFSDRQLPLPMPPPAARAGGARLHAASFTVGTSDALISPSVDRLRAMQLQQLHAAQQRQQQPQPLQPLQPAQQQPGVSFVPAGKGWVRPGQVAIGGGGGGGGGGRGGGEDAHTSSTQEQLMFSQEPIIDPRNDYSQSTMVSPPEW